MASASLLASRHHQIEPNVAASSSKQSCQIAAHEDHPSFGGVMHGIGQFWPLFFALTYGLVSSGVVDATKRSSPKMRYALHVVPLSV